VTDRNPEFGTSSSDIVKSSDWIMKKNDPILEKITLLKPEKVLDVGCGCGSFTSELSPYCKKITAIEPSPELIKRCKSENRKPNITYLCMDGRDLGFPDNSFDLVLERTTLHHIFEWEKALAEMIRVSAKYILIEEPLDDPRSEAKRNTIRAQNLYLEIEKEVGYSHYRYIPEKSFIDYFRKENIKTKSQIIRSDKPKEFDEYFSNFGDFAERSKRKKYWLERLDNLRKELGGKKLCEEDSIFIIGLKQ
jgi:ubiquinone/menaquinone biosynthesis C-methylase UbiE